MEKWEHCVIGILYVILGTAGYFLNGYGLYTYKQQKSQGNIILAFSAIINIGIITFAFPLSATASIVNNWFWGDFWCTYYGIVALCFGFNMMAVPLMLLIDSFFEHTDANHEEKKHSKRKKMIFVSIVSALFWGLAPLFGWSEISYEESGLSCTIWEKKPGFGYILYMILSFTYYFILPLFMMIHARISADSPSESASRTPTESSYMKTLILIICFIVEWTPYSIMYIWPIFSDPKTMPMRLSAVGPLFAKFAVITTPIIYFSVPKSSNLPKSKET